MMNFAIAGIAESDWRAGESLAALLRGADCTMGAGWELMTLKSKDWATAKAGRVRRARESILIIGSECLEVKD